MRHADAVLAVGIVVFGGGILEETLRKLPYYVGDVPGPGFLPLWLSLPIIALGLMLTVRAVRAGASAGGQAEWPDRGGWQRIAIVLVVLAMGLWLLESLGFFATTVLYVAVVGFGLGMRSWRVLGPVSLLMAIVVYGVFGVWLKVPLPKGIFEFLG